MYILWFKKAWVLTKCTTHTSIILIWWTVLKDDFTKDGYACTVYVHALIDMYTLINSPSRPPYAFDLDHWGTPLCRDHPWTCAWLLWRHGRPELQWPPGAIPSRDPPALPHTVPTSIQPAWLPYLSCDAGGFSVLSLVCDSDHYQICNYHYQHSNDHYLYLLPVLPLMTQLRGKQKPTLASQRTSCLLKGWRKTSFILT